MIEVDKIDLIEGSIQDLQEVYPRYTEDFAKEEQKSSRQLEALLKGGNYKLLFAIDNAIEQIIGYAFIYEFACMPAIWIDYIAINKEHRGSGYGSEFFKKIAEYKQDGIGVFLEVEMPEAEDKDDRAIQLRRISFYERLGAEKLDVPYLLPTENGGFPMYLYFKSSQRLDILRKEHIQEAITEVYTHIHSDLENAASILKTFITEIHDQPLK